jgi:hypothetical protein
MTARELLHLLEEGLDAASGEEKDAQIFFLSKQGSIHQVVEVEVWRSLNAGEHRVMLREESK